MMVRSDLGGSKNVMKTDFQICSLFGGIIYFLPQLFYLFRLHILYKMHFASTYIPVMAVCTLDFAYPFLPKLFSRSSSSNVIVLLCRGFSLGAPVAVRASVAAAAAFLRQCSGP